VTASPFIAAWVERLATALGPRRRALDLAMGGGRHTEVLLEHGFRTFGVDLDRARVAAARDAARRSGFEPLVWVSDLTTAALPREAFDLLVCTCYLDRGRWPDFIGAVRPGGYVLYETFTTRQLAHPTGPRSPDHLLRPGEILQLAQDCLVLLHEEDSGPPALARLATQRPGR
jgi:2-polyprenyl-3-methyl-5-hydroxy-6-metoxy-1,4-benzoquinol methylase